MNWLHELAQYQEFPIIAAFALGVLTAISPCPLATNITATAYISRDLKSKKAVLWSGFLYTLGRGITYGGIGLILYWGASKFHVARFFQSKGEMYLAPILIIIGLIMLGAIKLSFLSKFNFIDRLSDKVNGHKHLGALTLGVLFAMAFCPYSGALYFGILIPMSIGSASGLYLPWIFAFGTGIPVMIFAFLLAFSASKVGKAYNAIRKIEVIMRYISGIIFIITGIYYILIFIEWI
jgi:cytochrome c biogenesis protein CcdA